MHSRINQPCITCWAKPYKKKGKKKGSERFGKKPEKKYVRRKEKIKNIPCEE
jgi:hypothetical protein